jgi:hypothetical protein
VIKSYKILVLILSLALLSSTIFADSSPFLNYANSLGVYASFLGGQDVPAAGLAWNTWLNRHGVQVWGGGYYQNANYYYNISAAWRYMLLNVKFNEWFASNIFTTVSAGYFGAGNESRPANTSTGASELNGSFLHYGGLAAGFGVELLFFEHFSIPIEFGYAGQFPNISLGFSGGIGLLYRF